MKRLFFRTLSIVLTLVLMIQLLPPQAFAQTRQTDQTAEIPQTETSVTQPVLQENLDAVEIDPEATILGEIVEERSEFSKSYKLSNGMNMAIVYPEPVHYEEDGRWKDIDNTLQAIGSGNSGKYVTTAGSWQAAFPQQLQDGARITVSKGGYSVGFEISGELRSTGNAVYSRNIGLTRTAAQTVSGQVHQFDYTKEKAQTKHPQIVREKIRSRVSYLNAYQNTDIIFDINSRQLKESVVMRKYDPELTGYAYTLHTGTLIPALNDDGSIDLRTKDGKETIFTMPAPFLIDALGEVSYDIAVSLVQNGDSYILSYRLPANWLSDQSRQWPVVLDPAITAQSGASSISDQCVMEVGAVGYTNAGLLCGSNSYHGKMRTFIQFKALPALSSADIITHASLSLFIFETTQTTTPIEVHEITASWDSKTITWNTQPAHNPQVEDFNEVGTSGRFYWDITDLVQRWYTGPNYGLMLKGTDAVESQTFSDFKRFYSSDCGMYGSDWWPYLTVTYRNSNGLESYWDYTSASAGRAGTGYVNNYTGNLTWVRNDIGFGGNRMPVSISHIYNSADSAYNTFGLGNGWKTNYHQTISWDNGGYYNWKDGDGTTHCFVAKDGIFVDEDGLELTLTLNADGTYTITDKYGNKSNFDAKGRLSKLVNNQETTSSIDITYQDATKPLISEIKDGVGRSYKFTYNANDLLTQIDYYGTGANERPHISFAYTGTKLTSVTDNDGESTTYAYSNDLLQQVTDVDGYNILYTYSTSTPKRVVGVQEQDGGTLGRSLTIDYAHNQTTFTDHDGHVSISQYNDWGNLISVQDSEGGARFYQYGTGANSDPHRLIAASQRQETVLNLLSDSSFENATVWSPGSSAASASISTTESYYGSRSLQSVTSNAYGAVGATKSITVDANSSYTFSAFVKTVGSAAKLRITDSAGSYTESALLESSSNWTRLAATYTNTSSYARTITLSVYHVTPGTAYVDGVQLEKNLTARSYNMIENSDAVGGSPWVIYTDSETNTPTTSAGSHASVLTANRLMITGDIDAAQYVYQTVTTSGQAGDSFVFSGWTSGNVPPATAGDRFYGLKLTIYYNEGNPVTVSVPANADMDSSSDWQYLAGYAIATGDYYAVRLTAEHSYNANVVYFDGLQLYREEFGESYTYDERGNVLTVRDALGNITTNTYNTSNDLTYTSQPNGINTTYTYDTHHNPTYAVTRYTASDGAVTSLYSSNYLYDEYGNLLRQTATADGVEQTISYTYAYEGNYLASVTDASGYTTQYGYDPDIGVLNWERHPNQTGSTRTNYSYDEMFHLERISELTDQGESMSASYSYTDDQLTGIITPRTHYTFTYGDFGQRTGVSIGSRTLATYTYTNNENRYLEKLAYGNGDVVEYTYDDQGRVTQEIYKENGATVANRTVTYHYDNAGRVANKTDSLSGATTKYYYDILGRVVGQTGPVANLSHGQWYTYDDLGRVATVRDVFDGTAATTAYEYGTGDQISKVTYDSGYESYSYDLFNRLDQWHTYHGSAPLIHKNISYEVIDDQSGSSRPVAWSYVSTGGYSALYNYTYDGNGNILSETLDGYRTTYVYDSANQLIRENNQRAGKTWVWTYDAAGNIKSKKEYAYTTGTLGAELHNYTYSYGPSSDWGDLLVDYNGEELYYDTIGNLVRDDEWDYTWNQGRQLSRMQHGSLFWNFTYDADGMRTQRTNGTITYNYVYSGSQLSWMTVSDGTVDIAMHFTYDASGRPLAVKYCGATYYYALNLQGDVVAILNSSGSAVVYYTYDAWGNPLTISGSMVNTLGEWNPLRYRGYVYDQETGLYYLQSRYYNPTWGRFINADSQLATGNAIGLNLFAYCSNNPINIIDPNGKLGVIAIVGIVVSGIIGGTVSALNAAASGKDGWEIAANFAIGAATSAGTAALVVVAGAAMAAGTLSSAAGIGTIVGGSAAIGATGEGLSQATEYAFHRNDPNYCYNPISSTVAITHAAGLNVFSGLLCFGLNTTFASAADEVVGLFVSGEVSTVLGALDFGVRQIIAAILTLY